MIPILFNFNVLFDVTYQKSEFSILSTSLDDVIVTIATLRPQHLEVVCVTLQEFEIHITYY